MAINPDVLENVRTEEDLPELDLGWLRSDDVRKVEKAVDR